MAAPGIRHNRRDHHHTGTGITGIDSRAEVLAVEALDGAHNLDDAHVRGALGVGGGDELRLPARHWQQGLERDHLTSGVDALVSAGRAVPLDLHSRRMLNKAAESCAMHA